MVVESGRFLAKNVLFRLFKVVLGRVEKGFFIHFGVRWEGFQHSFVEGMLNRINSSFKELPTIA
jgi:hypothetical protein